MTGDVACSVVVAASDAEANLPAILDRLIPELPTTGEILVVANEGRPLPELPDDKRIHVIRGAADAPIPVLWRDGILAARSRALGVLTAHCIPDEGWLGRLVAIDPDDAAAVGGRIAEPPSADTVSGAIYCLRYPGASGTEAGPADDVAADNAFYDRDEILRCGDLLVHGFWEPAYHARFEARGRALRFDPSLSVTHANRYSARKFMAMRRHHGNAFARERVAPRGLAARLAVLAVSPLAFPIFAVKATRRVLQRPDLKPLFRRSAVWFYVFLANWSLGEISGYARALLDPLPGSKDGSR